MTDLGAYVAEQLSKGYSPQQIKAALSQYGYDPSLVDKLLSSQPEKKAEDQSSLASYVRRQLAAGYPKEDIVIFLQRYGYPEEQIDQAIKEAGPAKIVFNSKLMMMILIAAGIIAVGLGVFLLARSAPSIDFSLSLDKLEYDVGSEMVISNDLSRNQQFSVQYYILDGKGKSIDSWKETVSGSGFVTYALSVEPGSYTLKAVIKGSRELLEASQPFEVIPEENTCSNGERDIEEIGIDCGGVCEPCVTESCTDKRKNQDETGIDCGGRCPACKASCDDAIQNQGETGTDCGGPCQACKTSCKDGKMNGEEEGIDCGGSCPACEESCKDGKRNQDEVGVDCGGVCPACDNTRNAQLMQEAKNIAREQPEEAKEICGSIIEPSTKDNCFVELSRIANLSEYCSLASPSYRDGCYLYFVAQGNYEVCESITDTFIKMNCESLKAIRRVS